MRVSILGAGALGSLVGALLSRVHDVTLVGRRDHVDAVNRVGLIVEGRTELVARVHAVADLRDAPAADLLVVTVKAYDTAKAVRAAMPFVAPHTRVMTLQNGLGNVEALHALVPAPRVLAGVTTMGATLLEPGHIRHAGDGYLKLGSPSGFDEAAEWAAAVFRDAGLEPEVVANVEGELWAKVVVNAGINPATAITGQANGALLRIPELTELMSRACEEVIDVARASGVALPEDDLFLRTRRVAELTAVNKSSMLQDVERGRRTEIDSICGEVVKRGRELGVDTPVNQALLALVKGIEATTRVD